MIEKTHTVATWYAEDKDIEKLYRTDTGICAAERQGIVVIYGSEPNRRKSYVFIDSAHASKWLRETYPPIDLKEQGIEGVATVTVFNAESVVVAPRGTMEINGLASVRPFNKSIKAQ